MSGVQIKKNMCETKTKRRLYKRNSSQSTALISPNLTPSGKIKWSNDPEPMNAESWHQKINIRESHLGDPTDFSGVKNSAAEWIYSKNLQKLPKQTCAMVKSRYIGDGHPTFNRESL